MYQTALGKATLGAGFASLWVADPATCRRWRDHEQGQDKPKRNLPSAGARDAIPDQCLTPDAAAAQAECRWKLHGSSSRRRLSLSRWTNSRRMRLPLCPYDPRLERQHGRSSSAKMYRIDSGPESRPSRFPIPSPPQAADFVLARQRRTSRGHAGRFLGEEAFVVRRREQRVAGADVDAAA